MGAEMAALLRDSDRMRRDRMRRDRMRRDRMRRDRMRHLTESLAAALPPAA